MSASQLRAAILSSVATAAVAFSTPSLGAESPRCTTKDGTKTSEDPAVREVLQDEFQTPSQQKRTAEIVCDDAIDKDAAVQLLSKSLSAKKAVIAAAEAAEEAAEEAEAA